MDTKYTGITVNKTSIVISFTDADGVRHRESIYVGGNPTKAMIENAHLKRQAILYEIHTGTFDYAKHFPTSRNVTKFAKNRGAHIYLKSALKEWLKYKERSCARSTVRNYGSAIYEHLIPSFGHLTLNQLSAPIVKQWIIKTYRSPKTINNILIPLRGVMSDAYENELIEKNPLDLIPNLELNTPEPEPLSISEVDLVLSQLDGQKKNLIQFAFWSGLRTGELIGLRWKDLDLEKKLVHIRNNIVLNSEKGPKTKAGLRTIELEPLAIEAIENQLKYTFKLSKWVFHDPDYNDRWKNDQAIRRKIWMPALIKANVKYRKPYITRHTFASILLSNGQNPLLVATKMGHKDWGMIIKTYGRWLPK